MGFISGFYGLIFSPFVLFSSVANATIIEFDNNSNDLDISSNQGDSSQIDGREPDEVLFSGIEFVTDDLAPGERNRNDFSFASVEDLQFNALLK